jgi:hypothetical protein
MKFAALQQVCTEVVSIWDTYLPGSRADILPRSRYSVVKTAARRWKVQRRAARFYTSSRLFGGDILGLV